MDKIKVRINRNFDGSVEFEFNKEGFDKEDAKAVIESYLNTAKEFELDRINKAKELEVERMKIETETAGKFYENICKKFIIVYTLINDNYKRCLKKRWRLFFILGLWPNKKKIHTMAIQQYYYLYIYLNTDYYMMNSIH